MKNMQYVYDAEHKIPEEEREIASYRKFIHEVEVMVGNYRTDIDTLNTTEREDGIIEVIEQIEEFAKKFKLELDY